MRRSLRRQGNLLNGKPNTVAADPRSEALRALTRFVVSDASLSDTLTRIATITTEALPGAAFAGMTLLDCHGTPTTAIFTSPASPEIDAAQYETGEGPCLDAWRKQRAVLIDDTEDQTAPYRAFRAAARERGVRSTLSLPLLAPEGSLGALNLYAEVPHGFSEQDQAVGTELNDVAAILIQNSVSYWGAFELTQQLDDALSSRATIEQAKGVLMATTPGLDPEGAFDLLRRASQRENIKLRVIARRIVEQRTP